MTREPRTRLQRPWCQETEARVRQLRTDRQTASERDRIIDGAMARTVIVSADAGESVRRRRAH